MQPLTVLLVHLTALAFAILGIGSLACVMAWAGHLLF